MNTKSLLTRIGVPVLSLGLLGGLGATLATSASASTRGHGRRVDSRDQRAGHHVRHRHQPVEPRRSRLGPG